MFRIQRSLRVLPLLVLLAARAFAGNSVTWDKDWEAALARAAQDKKVVFLAVNMDGEAANDRMAQKVYSDERVVAASALTVNLVASRFDHAPEGRPCTRFAGIDCISHKRVDGAARQKLLKPVASGFLVAPQHVFAGPDGKILLSVPYEVTAEELAWCFAAAIKLVDPKAAKALPPVGRAPKRLVSGGVFDPSGVPGAGLTPPTKAKLTELLKELKASFWGPGRELTILQVLLSPEPEAQEFIALELKNDLIGRRGFGGGNGGGGDPTNPGGADGGGDRQDRLMHAIGVLSPPVYWKIVAEFLDHEDELLRDEAVVALEQLAAPESVRALSSALAKEKSAKVKKDLLRALASAGASDDKARKTLIKYATTEKDDLLRRNAIIALGWLSPGADVNKVLADGLSAVVPEHRTAAAIAMGLSRNEAWIAFLEKAVATEASPDFKTNAETALIVLKGASLSLLRLAVRALCEDGLERERFFGAAQ